MDPEDSPPPAAKTTPSGSPAFVEVVAQVETVTQAVLDDPLPTLLQKGADGVGPKQFVPTPVIGRRQHVHVLDPAERGTDEDHWLLPTPAKHLGSPTGTKVLDFARRLSETHPFHQDLSTTHQWKSTPSFQCSICAPNELLSRLHVRPRRNVKGKAACEMSSEETGSVTLQNLSQHVLRRHHQKEARQLTIWDAQEKAGRKKRNALEDVSVKQEFVVGQDQQNHGQE